MARESAAILLRGVSKRYGARNAVSELDLAVATGETLGFLGPNGAGKTTTLRMMMGFLRPSAGSVQLLGADMSSRTQALSVLREVGYVPDSAGLDPAAKGTQLLDDLAALQQVPALDRTELIDALELDVGDLQRPMGRLSRGTRQKINIVQALQHRPRLMILDEPTEGLDPITKRAFFGLLEIARERGATIFFSSHNLDEVEAFCRRVALIRAGTLVAVDRIEDLRAHLQRRVRVVFANGRSQSIRRQLLRLQGIDDFEPIGDGWRYRIANLTSLLQLLASLPVHDLSIEPPSLEDIFFDAYHAGKKRHD